MICSRRLTITMEATATATQAAARRSMSIFT
jgi:hypothetical protein